MKEKKTYFKKDLCRAIRNRKSGSQNAGITLIALVITIIVLLILASVTINIVLDEDGIMAKARQAVIMQKKVEYFEEINIEIIGEQIDRHIQPKDEAFIVSINERLTGQKQASAEGLQVRYTRKPWIKNTIMCDSHFNKNELDPYKNNVLIVETIEGYEIYIYVDNETIFAEIDENSFKKVKEPCIVKYDANGGEGTIADVRIKQNFTVILPENTLTRANYTFGGWCLDKNGNGTIYAEKSASDLITEDCTFYAVWTLNAVKLSFDGNDGTGNMDSIDVLIGKETKIPENVFTKEGYKFDKWTINKDGSGDSYNDLDNITINKDTILYAQWKDGTAPTVTITTMENSTDYLFAIKAQLSITDDNSGVDYSKCKYVFTTTNTPIGKDINNYTDGTISSTGTIEKVKGAESYYLHVLATDNEGNSIEKISTNSITVASTANFPYDSSKTFQTASLMAGEYQFECWGAKGGGQLGGNGAYTTGILNLNENKTIYAYIGSTTSNTTGGYNGGGNGAYYGGGGATDFRIKSGNWNNSESLASRIMVAAGGSGGYAVNGMAGGNLNGILNSGFTGTIATQKSAGTGGSFGIGNASTKYTGAGGGYYAGGTASKTVAMNEYIGPENATVTLDGTYKIKYGKNSSWAYGVFTGSVTLSNSVFGDPLEGIVKEGYKIERYHYISTGGSSYISGHEGCIGITSETNLSPKVTTYSNINNSYHYSGIIFVSTNMIAGNASMPGYSNNLLTGNNGNGYARITNKN